MTKNWFTRALLSGCVLALALPTIAVAQSGADLYKAKCAGCHGADGTKSMMGSKPLNGADVQKMSEADIAGAITNGKGKMPAYKGKLSDDQIKDLAKFVKSLK